MKNLFLLLLSLFTFIIPEQCLPVKSSKSDHLRKQCPKFESDESVVTSEDFSIPLNPHYSYADSRGFYGADKRIRQLIIVKKGVIPSKVFGLAKLEVLEVRQACFESCDKKTIPSNIQCFTSLKELKIYDTPITELPHTIGALKNLAVLVLSNVGLKFLPDIIGNLGSLTSLYLPGNQLKSLPKSIQKLKKLKSLTLSNNPDLHSIEVINNFLPSLETLDTRNCPIKNLSQNLPKLRTLTMTNNQLEQLNGIETLGSQSDYPIEFNFVNNRIRVISPSIGQVKKLRELYLSNNSISTLPSNIYEISTLRCVTVDGNFINSIELQEIYEHFKCD